MESLYRLVGLSRQAYHQGLAKTQKNQDQAQLILDQVRVLRKDHPRMGAREVYKQFSQDPLRQSLLKGIGRDKFEHILFEAGLKLRKTRARHRTTYSVQAGYKNLVAGAQIRASNQIWMSDITYFRIANSFVYITDIIDFYSRRCLGLVWGRTLEAESTVIPAIKMAFKARKGQALAQCIFHADGGGQYIDKDFLKLIDSKNMELSRAESCYENPFIEKFHDIVKNHYLIPWKVDSESRLDLALDRFMKLYNFHRPHGSLGGMTPAAFEAMALKMPEKKRKTMYVKPFK